MPKKKIIIKEEIEEQPPITEENIMKIPEIPPPPPEYYDEMKKIMFLQTQQHKTLIEQVKVKPIIDHRTFVEKIQEEPIMDERPLSEKVKDIRSNPPLEGIDYEHPYHYSMKIDIKNMGFRTFGVHLPNYYNIKSLSDRHIIFQYLLEKYENAGDLEYESEIYPMEFSNIVAMLLIAPGGMREEWIESRIF